MVRQPAGVGAHGPFHLSSGRPAKPARRRQIAGGSVRLSQYHSGRRRIPAATPARVRPCFAGRQNASRCAAKNDIQPTRQGRNAPGLRRGFLLRADFSFWLGATPRRAVLRCGFGGERTKNRMTDSATSRILATGCRRGALGFAGPVRLAGSRRRAAGPAGPVLCGHCGEDGGRTGLEAVQGARSAAAKPIFRPHLRSIRVDPPRAGHRDLERPETRLFARASASGFRLHDADRDQHCRERRRPKGDLRGGRIRLRQASASGSSRRPRLFRLAHSQGVGRGLRRRGDLPGGQFLSCARPGPALRGRLRAGLRFEPATSRARNFHCSASSGSRNPIRRPTR